MVQEALERATVLPLLRCVLAYSITIMFSGCLTTITSTQLGSLWWPGFLVNVTWLPNNSPSSDKPYNFTPLHSQLKYARSSRAAILAIIDCAITLPHTRVVVDDITKEMPAHATSLKWLKVTASTQKRSHTFQEVSYSKKSTQNKTLTSLKAIFPVNPLNSQFCG